MQYKYVIQVRLLALEEEEELPEKKKGKTKSDEEKKVFFLDVFCSLPDLCTSVMS